MTPSRDAGLRSGARHRPPGIVAPDSRPVVGTAERKATGVKKRLPRGTLSRAVVLEAAFRVVDAEDAKDLTMARLGRELDTDPSSIYRHFGSKEQLLQAMAEVLLEETYSEYAEDDQPAENVRRMAWALRRSYLCRPGLARLITLRSNDGPASRACMAALRQSMRGLGYADADGELLARVVAEVTLSHIAMTADELAQPARTQRTDLELAANSYSVPRERMEVSDQELHESVLADGERVFGAALELLIEALTARAANVAPRRRATRGPAAAPRKRTAKSAVTD